MDIIFFMILGIEDMFGEKNNKHYNSNHTINVYRTVNDNWALILEIEYTWNFGFRCKRYWKSNNYMGYRAYILSLDKQE